MNLGPRPAGQPWTPAEDAQLLALLDLKMDRPSIARKLKRTVSAIAKRLSILNKRRLVETRPEGEGEMIPRWLVQLGSLAGLLAFCVAIWDRVLSSRPLVWISPGDYGRQVHCKNIATHDITIRTIRCHPSNIGVASSTSLNAVVRASSGQGFMAILKADQGESFHLFFDAVNCCMMIAKSLLHS
jgi:hypothetical protein